MVHSRVGRAPFIVSLLGITAMEARKTQLAETEYVRPMARPSSDQVAPCPNCQAPMWAIRGSRAAICQNCGFKDSCCY